MTAAETNNPAEIQMSLSEVKYLETLLAEKKFPVLEQHCKAMLLKYPSTNSLNYLLGLSLNSQKKFTEAIESFNRFILEKTDYADAYANLGIAYERLDRLADALEAYNNALRLVPANPLIYNKIGVVLQKTGAFKEAAASFEQAVSLAPENPEYHLHLAMMYNNQGQNEKAATMYKKSIELDPDYVEAYRLMGTFMEQQHNSEEAIACYGKVAELKPDDFQNHRHLGNLYFEKGHFAEAVACYHNADRCRPGDAEIYGCLSAAYSRLGHNTKALDFIQRALQVNPDLHWVLNNFSKSLAVNSDDIAITSQLVGNIVRCHENARIDSTVLAVFSSSVIQAGLREYISKPSIEGLDSLDAITFRLLIAHMQNALICRADLENFLCTVRRELLNLCAERKPLSSRSEELLKALAFQSHLNEYIWAQTQEEKQKIQDYQNVVLTQIEAGKGLDKYSLFLLSAYTPIYNNEILRQWSLNNTTSDDEDLNRFLRIAVLEKEPISKLAEKVKSATVIENAVSRSVRQQYEENPYPQWKNISEETSRDFIKRLRAEILPNRPENLKDYAAPNVLIAGCGTGRHALNAARNYKNSTVLAVDLSLSSLAYAQSKAEDFNITNVEFKQADILRLDELDRKFDIIECSGVLHHMQEPEVGLKSLLSCLTRYGYLKLGLYSQVARRSVSELRNRLARQKVDIEQLEIRDFRALLRQNHPDIYDKVSISLDYYSASAFRDLLLHVQEHQYTIPDLKNMLSVNNLEFLGFITNDSRLKLSIAEKYPDDPGCINLDNWHQEELSRPQIFAGMYQFWCRRKPGP